MYRIDFPHTSQLDSMDCGPACLKSVLDYYGQHISLAVIRSLSNTNVSGTNFQGIKNAAESLDFEFLGVQLTWQELKNEFEKPVILHWNKNHFVVLFKIGKKHALISDPATGILKIKVSDLLHSWLAGEDKGYVAIIEPSEQFSATKKIENTTSKNRILNILKSFSPNIKQVLLSLVIISFIQLSLPFLTQSIVDYGIEYQRIDFIWLILFSQLGLILLQYFLVVVRDWHLLHISANVNYKILNNFLNHLVSLPINFFSTRNEADILQRIEDQEIIEDFVNENALTFFFDTVTIILFVVLFSIFSPVLFFTYIIGTILFFTWFFVYIKRKAFLDKEYFISNALVKSKILQLITNIEDIKVNASYIRRLGEWQREQQKQVGLVGKLLRLRHVQSNGALLISQISNIIIIFVAAQLVIQGELTLGTMMALLFIMAQLNIPLNNVTNFIVNFQLASLANSRMSQMREEPSEIDSLKSFKPEQLQDIKINDLSYGKSEGTEKLILDTVDVTIPKGKTTAIVGKSGAGKSTIFKLLLGLISPHTGGILIGNRPLNELDINHWRSKCSVVLQNGKLFNDSIKNNITEGCSLEKFDEERFHQIVKFTLLDDFIENQPYKENTKISEYNSVLSGGEKQRLLLARALYKKADYYLFDEPTSALDTISEAKIMADIKKSCNGKTVIIIAHRLSTIKEADHLIVLEKGRVIETGTHEKLVLKNGAYKKLIESQLENV